MSKQRATYYIGFMLLMSSLLVVVANNVPVLASFRWLWAPVFLIFSGFYYGKFFINRIIVTALLYGLFFVFILPNTIWQYTNDWYKKVIFEDFYAMIVFVILYAILQSNNYKDIWIRLTKLALFSLTITGVMTIIASNINPMIVRDSYSSGKFYMGNYNFLYKLGFGSYGFMIAIVALFPILVYFYKLNYKAFLSKRVILFLIIFFYYVIIVSQIFANILVSTVIIIISFAGARQIKKSIIYISLLLFIIVLIPKRVYIDALISSSELFEAGSQNNYKLNDMAAYLDNPVVKESEKNGAAGRVSRFPALFKAFIHSPFFGDASYDSNFDYEMASGGHLYFMSRLALWGVFGFIAYLIILINIFKPVVKMFDKDFRFYYYLSLISVILIGIVKNLAGREPYIVLLIIIPGLYLIKKEKEKGKYLIS